MIGVLMKHLVVCLFFVVFLFGKSSLRLRKNDLVFVVVERSFEGSDKQLQKPNCLTLALLASLASRGSSGDGLGLGDKHGVDVGKNTTLGNGDTAEELVELLVVAHGKLNVTGHNAGLLVVAGSVTGKLEDLSSEVLKDGSKVHRGTGTDTGSELTLLQEAADTGHGELKSGLGALAHGLSGVSSTSLSSFSFSRHD